MYIYGNLVCGVWKKKWEMLPLHSQVQFNWSQNYVYVYRWDKHFSRDFAVLRIMILFKAYFLVTQK